MEEASTQLFMGAAGVLAVVGMQIAAVAYKRMIPPQTPAEQVVSSDEEMSEADMSPETTTSQEDMSAAMMTKDLAPEFEEVEEEMKDISNQFEEISVQENARQRKPSARNKPSQEKEATAPKQTQRKTRAAKAEALSTSVTESTTTVESASTKRATRNSAAKSADTGRDLQEVKEASVLAATTSSSSRRSRKNKENVSTPQEPSMEVDLEPIVDVEVEMRQPGVVKAPKPARKKASDKAADENDDEREKQTFCRIIDRNVEDMTIDRHRALLASSTILSVRTLQNLVRGTVDAVPDVKDELVETYLMLFHSPPSETKSQKKPGGKRATAPAPADTTPSPPKRSRRTPLRSTQPTAVPETALPAKSPRAKASKGAVPVKESKAAVAARVEMEEGEEIELERSKFRVGKVLANGADSRVYVGVCVAGKHAGQAVAIKVQPRHCKTIFQITTEHHVLQKLQQVKDPELNVQTPIAYGCYRESCYVLVTNLLGPTLLSLIPAQGTVSAANTLLAAYQGLAVLRSVHGAGYVHRDVKPENLVLSHTGKGCRLHLIDFGTAEALLDRNGRRKTQSQAQEGSLPYMSTSTHDRAPLGKRDDVEGLLWTLLRMHQGALPWEKLSMKAAAQACKLKKEWLAGRGDVAGMDAKVKTVLLGMAEHVRALDAEDEPDYAALQAMVKKAWQGSFPAPSAQAYQCP